MIVLHLSHEEKLAIILIALILLFVSVIFSICLASPVCLINQWLEERLKERRNKLRQHQLMVASSLATSLATSQALSQTTTTSTTIRQQQQHQQQTLVTSNDFITSAPKTLTITNNNDADNISIIIRAQNQAPPSYDKAVQLDCVTAHLPSRHYHENIQLAGTVHYQVDKRLPGSGTDNSSLLYHNKTDSSKSATKKQHIDLTNYADYFHQPDNFNNHAPTTIDHVPPTQTADNVTQVQKQPNNFRLPIPLIVAPLAGGDHHDASTRGEQTSAGRVGPILMRFWLRVLDEDEDEDSEKLQKLQKLQEDNDTKTPTSTAPGTPVSGVSGSGGGGSVTAAVSLEDLSSLSSGQSSQSSNCSNCSNNKEHDEANLPVQPVCRSSADDVILNELNLESRCNKSVISKNAPNSNHLGVYGVNIAGFTFNSTTTTPATTGLTLSLPKIAALNGQQQQQQQQPKDDSNATKKTKRHHTIRFKVSICDIENLTQQHLHNYLMSVDSGNSGSNINNYPNHTSLTSYIYVQCDLMAPTKSRYLRPMIPMSSKMRDARPVVTFRTVSQRLYKLEDHQFVAPNATASAAGNLQHRLLAPITVCPIYQPINATFITPKLTNNLLSEGYIRMRIFIENKHVNDVCVAQLKLPISSVLKGTQQQQQQQQQQRQQQQQQQQQPTVTSISSTITPDSSSSGCSSMTLQAEPFENQHHHLALSYECEMLHEIKGQALLGLSYLPTSNRVILNAYRASIDDTDKDLKKLLLQTGNSYFLRFMMMVNGRVIKKKRTPVVTRQNITGQQQTKLVWDSQESITFDLVNINVDQPDFVVVLILRQQQQQQQPPPPPAHKQQTEPSVGDPQWSVQDAPNDHQQSVISANPIASTASNFAKRFMLLSQNSNNNNNINSNSNNNKPSATSQTSSDVDGTKDSQLRSSASVGNFRQHNIKQNQNHNQHDNDSNNMLTNVNRASFYNSEPEHLSLKRYLSTENNELEMSGASGQKRRRDLVIGHVVLGETIWQEMKLQPRRQMKREFLLY